MTTPANPIPNSPTPAVPPAPPVDPAHRSVGPLGTVVSAIVLAVLGGLMLYVCVAVWPHKPPGAAASLTSGAPLRCDTTITPRVLPDSTLDPTCATLFGTSFVLWAEHRLLAIVVICGALGGLLHGLRSLGWYIGNRALKRSWLPYYVMLPLIGSILALAFYVVLRGGLISPSAAVSDTSAFGIAAVAVLVGMFSTPATLKLQQVAETLFTKAQPGNDAAPQHAVAPTSVTPTPVVPPATANNGAGDASPDSGERGDDGVVNGSRSLSGAQG